MIYACFQVAANIAGFTLAYNSIRNIINAITEPWVISLLHTKQNTLGVGKVKKFQEAVWRCIMYSGLCLVGGSILFYPETKIWMVDTQHLWLNWPFHEIPPIVKIYYYLQVGCYFHQLVWTDVRRKDYNEMFVHHIVTISLIWMNYICHLQRAYVYTVFIHDIADIFLEMAKCLNYAANANKTQPWIRNTADMVFALFAGSFAYTRLYVLPFVLIRSFVFESILYIEIPWFCYYGITGLGIVLQYLHVYWFSLILRMVYRLFTTGIEKDERSDDERSDEEQSDEDEETD